MTDQSDHISTGGVTEIHHDVRVHVRNLRVAHAKALEAALIHQPTSAHSLNFLEDRASARMPLKPRMPRAAPTQVFLHDAVHHIGIAAFELEGCSEYDVAAVMKNGVVVPELHIRRVNRRPPVVLLQQLRRFKHLGNEHGPLPFRRGRQEMQILPDCAANGAWNTYVVFQSGPTSPNGFGDECRHHRSALDPHASINLKREVRCHVTDNKATYTLVRNQDIRAESEHEPRNLRVTRGQDCSGEIVGRRGVVQQVSSTADLEGGERGKKCLALQAPVRQTGGDVGERGGSDSRSSRGGGEFGHWPGKEIMNAVQSLPYRPFERTMLTIVFALAAFVHPLGAQRAELERRIKRDTLPNGLEIIVVENHGVPLATVEADAKNGSFTQSATYEGLSHLYEHMFFKANAVYPQPEAFVNRASELGAVFNGTTQEEQVNYYLTVPSDSTYPALALLASALRSPLFLPDELERERAVVIGEYDRAESDPSYALRTAAGKALWGNAWSRKNPLGERNVILATTPDQMRTIQKKYYTPNNTALIVTGDVNADSIFAAARSLFGSWQRAEDPAKSDPIPPVPQLLKNVGVVVEQPVNAVLVMVQWQGPGAHTDIPATYAADVFSDVLNQPGSRFQRKLADSGLWQSIGVNYYTLNHVGPITISGEVAPEKLRDAIAALDRELAEVVKSGYITTEAVDGVKKTRIVGTMESLERSSGFAHQLGFWWAVTGLDYFFGYVDTMGKQTPEDLRNYAKRYIVGRSHVTGVLVSPETRKALKLTENELAGGTP